MAPLGRILLADDEPTFLESTSELLRRSGYECDKVTDARAAAHLLRLKEYDLLIADINMPGNSQLEFVRELPKIAPGLPVILVTGFPALDTAVQSFELSVVGYLPKPLSFDELLACAAPAIKYSQNFRSIRKLQQRSQDVTLEVERIERLVQQNGNRGNEARMHELVTIALRKILESLTELQFVSATLAKPERDEDFFKNNSIITSKTVAHSL